MNIARYYLEDNDWNCSKAELAYNEDFKWQNEFENKYPNGQQFKNVDEFLQMVKNQNRFKN